MCVCIFFFFNDTATTEIYTLSLPRRSSDLAARSTAWWPTATWCVSRAGAPSSAGRASGTSTARASCTGSPRSEEHTSELQSRQYLVCRLLLEKKKKTITRQFDYNHSP